MRPSTEQAIVFQGRREIAVIDKPVKPDPLGPDEVAGFTRCSLISPGTEIQGQLSGDKFPVEPGYAAVFEIQETGDNVTALKPGDLVLTSGPAGIGGHHGFQRAPQQATLKLPKTLKPAAAVWARLIAVGMASLSQTTVRSPARLAVFGLGPVGNTVAQAAMALGYEVVGIDPSPERRQLAESCGVQTFGSRGEVIEQGGGEVALSLECSGAEPAVFDACQLTQKWGEVFIIGVPWRRNPEHAVFDLLHPLFRRCLSVRCGWEWSLPRYPTDIPGPSVFGNMADALKLLAGGKITVDPLANTVSHRDAPAAYLALAERRHPTLSAVIDWS